jgi:ferrous iron transport protein A
MQSTTSVCFQLAELKTGEHAFLAEIHNEREIVCRMSSLGLTPGVEIIMTQNIGRGPLVVTVRGTRIALGRNEAQKSLVRRKKE